MKIRNTKTLVTTTLFWGSVWGIFEAVIGYFLHLLPISIGAYIWFPAAYFFMERTYVATGQKRAVVLVALLSASIKLLNLLTPIRLDYVINPAASIVLEALVMICVIAFSRNREFGRSPMSLVKRVLSVNTLWRVMYTLYAGFIIPAWMQEVSLIRDASSYLSFILLENLASTLICVAAMLLNYRMLKAVSHSEQPKIKNLPLGIIGVLFVSSLFLQILL